MASPFRLIRPAAGTLARNQGSHLGTTSIYSSLHTYSFSNGRSVAFTSFVAKRAFSISAFRSNSNSNNSNSSSPKDIVNKSQAHLVEEESAKKLAAEAERKRVEAQDAALKEILESAAAEKKKLEEEALRIAEEKARRVAKEAAEVEAARLAKAKADAQAREASERAARAEEKRTAERMQAAARLKAESIVSSPASQESIAGSKILDKEPSTAKLSASIVTNDTASHSSQGAESGSMANGVATSSSDLKDDPLEQLKSRLMPYRHSLTSSTEHLRSNIFESLRDLSESIKRKDYRETIAQLSEHLNNFTGYNSINDLKHKVTTHGAQLDEARVNLVQAKQLYEDAIKTRSDTQKAINDLLQRKHLWSPNDVIRFTDLYRSEHANEQAEAKSKQEYKQAEANVEEKSRRLTTIIMERYHEEQVWSDKIRAASTYGTWGLIGMNVMAFLIVQAFVEPRRRRKQVERYEELVQDLTERGVLPEKKATPLTTGSAPTSAAVAAVQDASPEETKEVASIAVGGALLGGEDVLLKMIQSAERQEERLDRVEHLLRQQIPGAALETDESDKPAIAAQEETEEAGEFIVAEDGTILFVSDEKDAGTVDMGESWGEEVTGGSISRDTSVSIVAHPSSRFSRVLKDGDVEVVATRRDFLLSGLGGAIIGGLVTLAVMMNR
ncbi:sensitivity to high expression protein she9 [Linnemannia exigua]|uniref:Sensitive to high expression protein 9, mitochondrial n=1 Tax=Linnemannia exigua TaxID=604196 RepID=A0AAD4HA74_9FUNG|nr:sensitivity to high expression protein she9 [Linnemannia exigua]